MRTQRFNMLLNADEVVMMQNLAEARGLTSSDLLRTLLREAFGKAAKEYGKTPTEHLAGIRDHKLAKARTTNAARKGGK